MKLSSLISDSRLETLKDVKTFHKMRVAAFAEAERVYKEREPSYNVDHEPTEEMVYGPVSLASELFKRIRRMTSILSPSKTDIDDKDIARLEDTCIDTLNYASWQWALIQVAKSKAAKPE